MVFHDSYKDGFEVSVNRCTSQSTSSMGRFATGSRGRGFAAAWEVLRGSRWRVMPPLPGGSEGGFPPAATTPLGRPLGHCGSQGEVTLSLGGGGMV